MADMGRRFNVMNVLMGHSFVVHVKEKNGHDKKYCVRKDYPLLKVKLRHCKSHGYDGAKTEFLIDCMGCAAVTGWDNCESLGLDNGDILWVSMSVATPEQ